MSSQENMKKLARAISSCQKCPLGKTRMNPVPGAGSFSAKIVFIGEGPGAREDKLGVPFVGASGKFLDEMLEKIGLKRADVFVTNIVKCRPPDNRDPLPEESDLCSQLYLWKQLEIIKPKIIITLGRHAMYRFLPKNKKISDIHGKPCKFEDPISGQSLNILPLYHPAAALYNGSMRETLIKDFKKIPRVLKKIV